VVGLLFLLSLLFLTPPAQSGLFGSSEVTRPNIALFPKWTGVMRRNTSDDVAAPCAGAVLQCRSREDWVRFVEATRLLDKRQQLSAVNAELNRFRYITDPQNWGVPDYWSTLLEFLGRDGDCEDYAIAKYVTLKALGWTADSMRVAIVQDENLNVPHAILAVRLNGDTFILDNQISQVMPDNAIRHYRPIYSINETAWWLHNRAS
jgi:predicted transglutaminase-like cysteine proteinase